MKKDNVFRRILGVDPGTRKLGYGILADGKAVSWGTLQSHKKTRVSRIQSLYEKLKNLDIYNVHVVAVETPFYNPKAKYRKDTIQALGEARGMIMCLALYLDAGYFDCEPKKAKKSATGNGNASKQLVNQMIRAQFCIPYEIGFDASDALAVALCCWNRYQIKERVVELDKSITNVKGGSNAGYPAH